MNPASIFPLLLLGLLLRVVSASPSLEIETSSLKKRVALCFSPSPAHLLSINEKGELISIKATESGSEREIQIEAVLLSPEETSSIREIALAVERDFQSSLMDIPSDVISISEVATAPRDHKISKGMVAWRIWIDGRAWEFYARGTSPDASPWNKNLALLEELVTEISTRVSAVDLEPGTLLVVLEKPRHYFMPNLHSSIIPSATVTYVKKIKSSDLAGTRHPLSSSVGYSQPGAWFFTSSVSSEYLSPRSLFLSKDQFVRGVEESTEADIDDLKINQCPVARENMEASVWAEPIGTVFQ